MRIALLLFLVLGLVLSPVLAQVPAPPKPVSTEMSPEAMKEYVKKLDDFNKLLDDLATHTEHLNATLQVFLRAQSEVSVRDSAMAEEVKGANQSMKRLTDTVTEFGKGVAKFVNGLRAAKAACEASIAKGPKTFDDLKPHLVFLRSTDKLAEKLADVTRELQALKVPEKPKEQPAPEQKK